MKAPALPRKQLSDLSASELRKLYERVQAYSSYQNQRIIELGYGHVRYNELREYIHVPMVRAYLEFDAMTHRPVVDEMRKREAWHGDKFKPISKRYRNPAQRNSTMDKHAAIELKPSLPMTARKKIAVNAKSRATGKAPSARLKKRRARNTVPGAYPNPAKRKTGTGYGGKEYIIFAAPPFTVYPKIYYYAGDRFSSQRSMAVAFRTQKQAKKVAAEVGAMLPAENLTIGVTDNGQNVDAIRKTLMGKA